MNGDSLRSIANALVLDGREDHADEIRHAATVLDKQAAELDALRERAVPEGWEAVAYEKDEWLAVRRDEMECRRYWRWQSYQKAGQCKTLQQAIAAAEAATEEEP